MKRPFCKSGALLLLFSIVLLFSSCAQEQPIIDAPGKPTNGTGVATLCAVGDIYLTEAMLTDAQQTNGSYDFSAQLSGVINTISSADIAIGNFEGNFSGEPYADGSHPDAFAAALGSAGFDILQTANSYSIHNGIAGLRRTKSTIEAEHITPLGTYASAQERNQYPIVLREINGVRFAFIAFTKGLNSMSLPAGAEYCVNLLYTDYNSDYSEIDTEGITALIAEAQLMAPDVIVAAVHWGSENISEVSRSQEEIAQLMFYHGVDVILGSHSHRVGSVERRTITSFDGREKEVVLAYSLGDFCCGVEKDVSPSIILNLEFTRDHEKGITHITDLHYVPIATVDRGQALSNRFAVINIDTALDLYEKNYYDRIDEDLYEEFLEIKEDLSQRTNPVEEE